MTELKEPPVVKKLDESVVNRIAAGEVIQRPSNAIKELLENSLDAKSTNIQVTLKDGGLKLLQIQDNGVGIRKDDLSIVCERFTTSKLVEFDDLNTITTYGFRGEALASISHIAHLTIVTKAVTELCAYKATYEYGKLVSPIKLCAGNQGTQITVQDLFYNMPARKRALTNVNEEYLKIADVIGRYAIHNHTVGFTLRKQSDGGVEIKTNENSTCVDNIRNIYGNDIAKSVDKIELEDQVLKFKLTGYITNSRFSVKKQIFIIFINNRLVESLALRKTIEEVYSQYLGKGMHGFIYLSITLDPKNVDVNIHPTKHEVHFLHEESIIDKIKAAVESKLRDDHLKLPPISENKTFRTETVSSGRTIAERGKTIAPNRLVRTSSTDQKLDKYLSQTNNYDSDDKCTIVTRREIKLTAVLNIRKQIEDNVQENLKEILHNFTFVGMASHKWILLQHKTELYCCNIKKILFEAFYQIMFYEFGNMNVIKFSEPLNIERLISIALELPESNFSGSVEEKTEKVAACTRKLNERSDMLADYFSLHINKGHLITIPVLVDNYVPYIEDIPLYLYRLATEVDWRVEEKCYMGVCQETARFYSHQLWNELDNVDMDTELEQSKNWSWTVEHVLLTAIRKTILPSDKLLTEKAVVKVASLPDLYKIFERC